MWYFYIIDVDFFFLINSFKFCYFYIIWASTLKGSDTRIELKGLNEKSIQVFVNVKNMIEKGDFIKADDPYYKIGN